MVRVFEVERKQTGSEEGKQTDVDVAVLKETDTEVKDDVVSDPGSRAVGKKETETVLMIIV